MPDELNERLRAYGAWLDKVTDDRGAHAHERVVVGMDSRRAGPTIGRGMRRVMASAAVAVALVAGSLIVNGLSTGGTGARTALAWSETPRKVEGIDNTVLEAKCTTEDPEFGEPNVDIRGDVGVAIWGASDAVATYCVFTVATEPGSIALVERGTASLKVEDYPNGSGATVVHMTVVESGGQRLNILFGFAVKGAEGCRTFDVQTNVGTAHAEAREGAPYAVWFPGELKSYSFMCTDASQIGTPTSSTIPMAMQQSPTTTMLVAPFPTQPPPR